MNPRIVDSIEVNVHYHCPNIDSDYDVNALVHVDSLGDVVEWDVLDIMDWFNVGEMPSSCEVKANMPLEDIEHATAQAIIDANTD